jgi:hypothetical protein
MEPDLSGCQTVGSGSALDDEVALVGAVMQAEPSLTVGPVSVGPHACP